MFIVRKIKLFFILILLLVSLSLTSACTNAQHPQATASTNFLTPESIAQYIALHYTEAHPKIISARPDHTDNSPHDPMYEMTIAGHFTKGSLVASSLSFSALANRMYVWNIYAFNEEDQEIWHDLQLAGGV